MTEKPTYEALEKKIQELERAESERKASEEAFQEKEAYYSQLFDSLPYGCEIIDTEGIVVNCSQSTLHMLGYKKDEIIGKHITEFVDAETIKAFEQNFPKVLKGDSLSLEGRMIHKKGNIINVLRAAKPIFDKGENIVGMLALSTDITRQKHAEKALRASEKKYCSMMEAITDPVYICSPDFRVQYMNPAMIKRIGQDDTGKMCFEALHDLKEKCPWCKFDMVQQGKISIKDIVSPKDNKSFHVSSAPIYHDDGSVSKISVYRDITQLSGLKITG